MAEHQLSAKRISGSIQDTSQRGSENWMLQRFQSLLDLLTGIGFSMLAAAGQVSLPVGLVFLGCFVPLFHSGVRKRFQLTQARGNLLTWIYVPVFVLDIFLISGSFVPATLHLILFVQLVRSYQPSVQDRDYVYLLVLSFLQVLAASSLTIDLAFLILFAIYLLVCLATLMVFEITRAAKRIALQDAPVDSLAAHRDPWSGLSQRMNSRASRSLAVLSAGSLIAIMILGTGFFFAIPRFGSGYFHRAARSTALSGFSDRIRLGGIGSIQLDPAVVMRVRVKSDPTLLKGAKWRGVTLDYFDGTSWSKRMRGPLVSYPPGRDFPIQLSSRPGTTVDYQVWLEPSATSYLFTAAQVLHLRGSLTPLLRDPADDSFTARAHPSRRLAYDGVSRLPQRGEASQASDLRPAEKEMYLQLPPLDSRLIELAFKIAAGASTDGEKADRVEKYLRENYLYALDQEQLENPQPLAAFLLSHRRGHCEYFASSMVVLLRSLRIPARIVNGFQAGEYNEIGENFVIRGRDAHSWAEVWLQEQGWVSYDPTPVSSDRFPRSSLAAALGNYLDAFELFWAEWVVGYDDVIQVSLFRDLQDKASQLSWLSQKRLSRVLIGLQAKTQAVLASAAGTFAQSPASILLCASATGILIFLLVAIRQRWNKPGLTGSMRESPGRLAVRFYGEFLDLAAACGHPKPTASTPNEFAASFKTAMLRRQVQELTDIYHVLRFCPGPPGREGEARRAGHLLRELQRHARRHRTLL